jgi:HSP20 family protein
VDGRRHARIRLWPVDDRAPERAKRRSRCLPGASELKLAGRARIIEVRPRPGGDDAVVMRFDPFRDLDRLAQQAFGGVVQVRSIPMDAYRRGDAVFLHFDLPGIDPDTIDLTVEQNVLTVTAERLYERKECDQIIAKERLVGAFERQMFLGEHLDPDRLQASYEQGVLTIQIPVAPEAKPRRIEIRAGEGSTEPQMIEVEGKTTQESE